MSLDFPRLFRLRSYCSSPSLPHRHCGAVKMRISTKLTLAWCLIGPVASQLTHYGFGGAPSLCNQTFADANATGLYYINPGIFQASQADQPENAGGTTLPSAWALTIQNSAGALNADSSLSSTLGAWYSTNGANYSDDLNLGYDVCAIVILSLNDYADLRGQADNGTCLSVLDQSCVTALQTATQQSADWLVGGNIKAKPNITSTSLPVVCNDIGAELTSNMPTECAPFFVDAPLALGVALTTTNNNYKTFLNESCTMNGTFRNVVNLSANSSLAIYTNVTRLIAPVLTVFMPVANQEATISITRSVTELSCLHINHINEGSYVPPAEPTPTSTSDSSSDALSGGTIAGIVVGVILAILLICGIGFWFWRKRKVPKRGDGPERQSGQFPDHKELLGLVEAPQGAERYEFPANAPERYEMDTQQKRVELAEGNVRHEMPA